MLAQKFSAATTDSLAAAPCDPDDREPTRTGGPLRPQPLAAARRPHTPARSTSAYTRRAAVNVNEGRVIACGLRVDRAGPCPRATAEHASINKIESHQCSPGRRRRGLGFRLRAESCCRLSRRAV